MGNCVWEQAAGLELFQGLPPMLLKELLNGAKWVEYPKKKNVFSAGESIRTVYVVLDGKVMLYNLTRHGNRKILFFLGRESSLTIISVIPGLFRYSARQCVRLFFLKSPWNGFRNI